MRVDDKEPPKDAPGQTGGPHADDGEARRDAPQPKSSDEGYHYRDWASI